MCQDEYNYSPRLGRVKSGRVSAFPRVSTLPIGVTKPERCRKSNRTPDAGLFAVASKWMSDATETARCPRCDSLDIRLSRRYAWDNFLSWIFDWEVFRCRKCRRRFHCKTVDDELERRSRED